MFLILFFTDSSQNSSSSWKKRQSQCSATRVQSLHAGFSARARVPRVLACNLQFFENPTRARESVMLVNFDAEWPYGWMWRPFAWRALIGPSHDASLNIHEETFSHWINKFLFYLFFQNFTWRWRQRVNFIKSWMTEN